MTNDSKRGPRPKIKQATKIRSILQQEINSTCPLCDNNDAGHFEIHHIDENRENNFEDNLILVCPTCHSKITKGDILRQHVIEAKKRSLTRQQIDLPITKKKEFRIINVAPLNVGLISTFTFVATAISYFGILIKLSWNEIPTYVPGLFIIFIIISSAGIIVGWTLKRRGFLQIWRNVAFESNGEDIFITLREIQCPFCPGKMIINSNTHESICLRNPFHKTTFDYTKK